jgi:hypothetical protein
MRLNLLRYVIWELSTLLSPSAEECQVIPKPVNGRIGKSTRYIVPEKGSSDVGLTIANLMGLLY